MPAKNRRLLLKTAARNPLFQPISAESTEFTPDSGYRPFRPFAKAKMGHPSESSPVKSES
jgi:hypothetical protein